MLDTLEQKYREMKIALGSKLAEHRKLAGFGKSAQYFGVVSPNLLFKVESGENLPNERNYQYFVELYEIEGKSLVALNNLYEEAKELKKQIIRLKRNWR